MTDHPTSADAAAAGMDALGRAMAQPSLTDGLADREFAMPGHDDTRGCQGCGTVHPHETIQGTVGDEVKDKASSRVQPGAAYSDPDLGELARPFVERWFLLREHQESCVGAIRDFVTSSTFRRWWEAQEGK